MTAAASGTDTRAHVLRSSSGDATGATSRAERAALDRLLELVGRRGLSATELRILIRLSDCDAAIPELADGLNQRSRDVRRCGRRLAARGLISWRFGGMPMHTRLAITRGGLTTIRALLTAAGGAIDDGRTPGAADARRQSSKNA